VSKVIPNSGVVDGPEVIGDQRVRRFDDVIPEQPGARFLRAAGETGAEVLEQHRDTVELTRLARAVRVGIGDGILVNPEHRLDRGIEPPHGFRRLRRQFLSGELFRSNSIRKR